MNVETTVTPEILAALNLSDFVAVDIETTGLECQKEDIIEFAAVHFHQGEIKGHLNFFVRPTKPIPPHITRITGITDEDVRDARPFEQRLPEIRDFVGDYPIVAHNVSFDLSFLEYHARRAKGNFTGWDERNPTYHYFPNPKIDTLILSRMYLPFLNAFSLGALVEYFQFSLNYAHRALPDAEAAGRLFLELLERALRTKFSDVQAILRILEPTDEPIKTFFENLAIFLSQGKYHLPEGLDRDKFTIQAHHYNIIGEDEGPTSATTTLTPIDEEAVAAFFEEGGELAGEFRQFEPRAPQVEMARKVAQAFNEGQFLVIEAGTGTGKSMAYLVPAIKWAVNNPGPEGRVIISTNTKNLQEQLFFKDLPVLHSIMKEKFKAVLLKGKGNYLCLDKWVTVMSDMQYRLNARERVNILPLYFWVQQTETGDIAENNGFRVERNLGLWSKLIAENNYCPGKSCKYYDRCFLMKARNNAKDAHIVLVNHSLLFSDLAADNAVLQDYAHVILDEAHNIEKTATEYLGIESTLWQFRDFYHKLYQRERMETGVLVQLKRRVQAGNLKQTHLEALIKSVDQLTDQVAACWRTTQQFFRELTAHLRRHTPTADNEYATRVRYIRDQRLFDPVMETFGNLKNEFTALQKGLGNLIEYLKELPEDRFEYQRQLFQDLSAQYMQAQAVIDNLEFLLTAEWDTYVYWYELPNRQDSDDTRLYAAPLEIGNILSERLYARLRTAVFTSATLAVNRQFDYFLSRVGLDRVAPERLEVCLLESPFNYDEQVFLGVPSFLPEPGHPEFIPRVQQLLERLVAELPRGALVLFTSYSMMHKVYHAVRPAFEAEKVELLAQGIDGSRHSLINRFKANRTSVLLGTDSFWEGVDVPGEALELVLIARLPFDVPSDPVIQARSELIQRRGGNPFMEYAIPEAVIRFRQGFGRLIRHRSDYGAVIVLDSRVVKKLYGRIFLESLPVRPIILADEEEFWDKLKEWF